MELAKCPFMGGKKCIATECALWVPEHVLKKDFQSYADKWQDKETVLPPHCCLNKESAEVKTFVRIAAEGKIEEDDKDQQTTQPENTTVMKNWYDGVYMT